jgi:hypothetical protein
MGVLVEPKPRRPQDKKGRQYLVTALPDTRVDLKGGCGSGTQDAGAGAAGGRP